MGEPAAGWHSHSRVPCQLPAAVRHPPLEKCPQSLPAVASAAFSSLKTFQSRDQDGDWEERGTKRAASHPSLLCNRGSSAHLHPCGGAWLERCHVGGLPWEQSRPVPSLAGARGEPQPAPAQRWAAGMKAIGTLQNRGNKDRVPEGTIWDSFAHKQDLELCVRAGKVLLLQPPPPCLHGEGDGSAWSHTLLQDVPINAK